MGKKTYFNKLVRDKIPGIIESNGEVPHIAIIENPFEFRKLLHEKLMEEYKEYCESRNLEKLADLVEVIRAIVLVNGVSLEDFEKMIQNKNRRRGSFPRGNSYYIQKLNNFGGNKMDGYLCYHHNDMDGKTAGFFVYKTLQSMGVQPNSRMFIQRGYDEPFSENDYSNKIVFIVDLSFTKESIKRLYPICEGAYKVIWIDHHKSSIDCIQDDDIREKLNSYHNLWYFVNNDGSGALLTYLFYKDIITNASSETSIEWKIEYIDKINIRVTSNDLDSYTVQIPIWLGFVDKYDRWVYGEDLEPLLFNCGLGVYNTALFRYKDKAAQEKTLNSFWNDLHTNGSFFNCITSKGNTIYNYIRSNGRSMCSGIGYQIKVKKDGRVYDVFVVNGYGNSLLFGNLIDKYDFVMLWEYNGKTDKFVCSLYSSKDDVDCAMLATSFDPNGGGHKGAAGFSSDSFDIRKDVTINLDLYSGGK